MFAPNSTARTNGSGGCPIWAAMEMAMGSADDRCCIIVNDVGKDAYQKHQAANHEGRKKCPLPESQKVVPGNPHPRS